MGNQKTNDDINTIKKERIDRAFFINAVSVILILNTNILKSQKQNGTSIIPDSIRNTQIHHSQPIRRGVGLVSYSSANGHGTFFYPSFTLSKGRNSIGIGPVIQKRSMMLNGFRLSYSHNLSGEFGASGEEYLDRLQINCFSYIHYNNKLPLSYKLVIAEERFKRGPNVDWSKVELSTAEVTAGIELRVNISASLCWKTDIGASLYYHVDYLEVMNHDRIAPSLSLGTGINFLFLKK